MPREGWRVLAKVLVCHWYDAASWKNRILGWMGRSAPRGACMHSFKGKLKSSTAGLRLVRGWTVTAMLFLRSVQTMRFFSTMRSRLSTVCCCSPESTGLSDACSEALGSDCSALQWALSLVHYKCCVCFFVGFFLGFVCLFCVFVVVCLFFVTQISSI